MLPIVQKSLKKNRLCTAYTLLSIGLLLVVLSLGLAACGSNTGSGNTPNPTPTPHSNTITKMWHSKDESSRCSHRCTSSKAG